MDTDNKKTRIITLSLNKALLIFSSAIIASVGGSVWATISIFNTVPFRVSAIEQQITEMRQNFMPLDLATEKWKNNDVQHSQIEKKLDSIEAKVDKLLAK